METYQNTQSQIFTEALPPTYAGFWRRFVAYLIDYIVLSVPGYLFGMMVGYNMLSGLLQPRRSIVEIFTAGYFATVLFTLVLNWLYYALQESGPAQATLGKRAMGVRIIGPEGQRISFANATGRYFGKIISGLILLIGFIMAGWDSRKQALHDKMANTFAIKE